MGFCFVLLFGQCAPPNGKSLRALDQCQTARSSLSPLSIVPSPSANVSTIIFITAPPTSKSVLIYVEILFIGYVCEWLLIKKRIIYTCGVRENRSHQSLPPLKYSMNTLRFIHANHLWPTAAIHNTQIYIHIILVYLEFGVLFHTQKLKLFTIGMLIKIARYYNRLVRTTALKSTTVTLSVVYSAAFIRWLNNR